MTGRVPANHLNHLFRGPVETLLKELPDESIDCIFADPDYNVGITYQGRSYTTRFEDYLLWCENWAIECHRILKKDGNLFIVNYPKNNAHLRVRLLDRLFSGVHDYAWGYPTNVGHGKGHFTTAHRSILHCTKSADNRFYKRAVAVPYKNPNDRRIRGLVSLGSPGRMPYSWFEFNLVKNVSRDKSFHSCQIPEGLSEMLFKATTKPGDTVCVLFGGAGSELVVAQRLGLSWVSAEIVPEYCDLIERRLEQGGRVPDDARLLTAIRIRQHERRSKAVSASPPAA